MPENSYLVRKHRTWHVEVNVPQALRERAGKSKFRKSLQTDSLARANLLKHTAIAGFKAEIAALRAGGESAEVARRRRAAQEFREALAATPNIEVEQDGYEVNEFDEEMSRLKDAANEILREDGPEEARRFFREATGAATAIEDHYRTWLDESQITGQTLSQNAAAVRRFLEWSGARTSVEETTRRRAGEYVSSLLTTQLSRRTVKRHLSSLSGLWRWFVARGIAAYNPWRGLEIANKAPSGVRQALPDDALLKLLKGTYSTPTYALLLSDLTRLALLTGARLDELCALKRSDVRKESDGYWLHVTKGKTAAASRRIPLHKIGDPIVMRRLKERDEYLFKGLTPGGPDKKRSWYVSKAYKRFRDQVGVSGAFQDFHALRNTFVAMMEGQGAPENEVKLIVGHKRASITYGHYSKGEHVQLRKVIATLRYGRDVMRALHTK